jgi:protein kinase-like protein
MNSITSRVTVAVASTAHGASRPPVGRIPRVVVIICGSIIAAVVSLVMTGIPIRYECVASGDTILRGPEFRNLIDAGVSPQLAAALDLAAGLAVAIPLIALGILLYARGRYAREALFVSVTLVLYGASLSDLMSVHRTLGPALAQPPVGWLTTALFALQTGTTFAALYWLPEGRFIPQWTRGYVSLLIGIATSIYVAVPYPRAHDLINLVGLPAIVVSVWAQTSHYRQLRDPVVRQRIKWVVIGLSIGCVGYATGTTATLVVGDRAGLVPRVAMVVVRLFQDSAQVALLVCFVIAIRRYRLWQIDLVINRSIVYGTVTVLLLIVFLGGGFALQQIVGSAYAPLGFAASTVGAGLLFSPARKFTQRLIDRRVYGLRFDLDELKRVQRVPSVANPGALSGRTLGEYRVLGVIGRGGMGEVYQAEADGRLVALKVLAQPVGNEFVKWFERESRALAGFAHPNIVKCYGSGQIDGMPYLVLEFVAGREVSAVIRERGRLPFEEVRSLLADLASALDYVHERGFVHRDIKPSNIMIRRKPDGATLEAVLMDFGIARTADALTAGTATGVVGTISYMAPEQIIAAAMVDRRCDIYALGVTLYEMLTGEVPFIGNPAQVLFAHLHQQPRDPAELVPGLPANVARGLMKALEKKPEDRFRTAGEFMTALGAAPCVAPNTSPLQFNSGPDSTLPTSSHMSSRSI